MQQQILELSVENAVKAYKEGTTSDKALLARLYGRKVFIGDPLEWVHTFKDVCEAAGKNPADYEVPVDADEETRHDIFHKKMKLIYKVFNGDWRPNYADDSQRKHYPYFVYDKRIGGFSLNYVHNICDGTYVGSRLCAKSDPIVRHICKYFMPEYNAYLLS